MCKHGLNHRLKMLIMLYLLYVGIGIPFSKAPTSNLQSEFFYLFAIVSKLARERLTQTGIKKRAL